VRSQRCYEWIVNKLKRINRFKGRKNFEREDFNNVNNNDTTCEELYRGCSIHISRKEKRCCSIRLWYQYSTSWQGFRKGFCIYIYALARRYLHAIAYFFYLTKCSSFCRKDGYLFDKEAILEYILTKKREYARKLKEYERQKQKMEVSKSWVKIISLLESLNDLKYNVSIIFSYRRNHRN
jgi:hypothetical protein